LAYCATLGGIDRDHWSRSAVDDVTIIDHSVKWSRQALVGLPFCQLSDTITSFICNHRTTNVLTRINMSLLLTGDKTGHRGWHCRASPDSCQRRRRSEICKITGVSVNHAGHHAKWWVAVMSTKCTHARAAAVEQIAAKLVVLDMTTTLQHYV